VAESAPMNLPDLLKKLIFGTGAGIGVMIAYIVFDAVHAKPELALQTFGTLMSGSGALTVVLLVALYFGNARVGEGLQVLRDNTSAQKDNAVAQRDLADAVQSLAVKDDREAEKQRLMLSYIAQQQEKILEKFETLDKARSRGASA
jgi:hypothetical protein